MIQFVIDWATRIMGALGAPGLGFLSFLETAIPVIPSEVVLPLAGFTASTGRMNIIVAYLWATGGAVAGAWLLYWLGAWIGVSRLGDWADKIPLLKRDDVNAAVIWFNKYGSPSVFFGRFVPGIRALISLPAGVDKMNFAAFTLWTLLGSAIWNAVLMGFGYYLGANWHIVTEYADKYSLVLKILIVVLVVVFLWFIIRRALRERAAGRYEQHHGAHEPTAAAADSEDTTK